MSFDVSSVAPIIIAIVTALGAYAGTKATTRAQKKAAEPANWQTLTTEMKSFFKEQLAERDQRIAALESENGLRGDYIAHLETIPEFTDPPFPSFHKWRSDR
nr:MAG TPA_asm: hypothetical protein [Caudoviricetes sp.]